MNSVLSLEYVKILSLNILNVDQSSAFSAHVCGRLEPDPSTRQDTPRTVYMPEGNI